MAKFTICQIEDEIRRRRENAVTIEITGTFLSEEHRFANPDGDVIVAIIHLADDVAERPEGVNGRASIKGAAKIDELRPNLDYRFFGQWGEYKNKRTGITRPQFTFQTFVLAKPASRAGIITYLKMAGKGHGIGHERATVLYEKFGERAIAILREQPDVAAAAVIGLSAEQAGAAAAWLREQQHLEGVSVELMELLDRRGFPKKTVKRCIDEWGNVAARLIKHDPYKLMRFRGIGFKKADAMYAGLGLPMNRLKRQSLAALDAMYQRTERDGHTWHPAEVAIRGIKANVAGTEIQPGKAITLAVRARYADTARTASDHGQSLGGGQLVDDKSGFLWLANRKFAAQEKRVGQYAVDAMEESHSWPDIGQVMGLSEHQRERLAAALTGAISIFGGSPGTGKTYSAAALILALINLHGGHCIAVAAPTGKAAVRITEALAGYGVAIKARTIHSLLGVQSRTDGDGWTFGHDENNPLPHRFLIVDESSMIDCGLMASLLAARAKGCCVLLVGDVNQLAPVGHGAPLRDLIKAGLPYGELREIQRNNGSIVRACAAIRDGAKWECDDVIGIAAGSNLWLSDRMDGDQSLAIRTIIGDMEDAYHFDPIWDCQVLVPVNAKSALSRRELNKTLQQHLNHSPGIPNCPFRLGDKVVNTKNGTFSLVEGEPDGDCDDGQTWVANGELGKAVEIEEKSLLIKLQISERIIRVPRGKGGDDDEEKDSDADDGRATNTGSTWDLAYALSVHKSQGSEFPVAIVVLDEYPGARMVCSREWIYTAISRAKKLCVLVGKKETADRMCKRIAIGDRKTLLVEQINRERVKRELARI